MLAGRQEYIQLSQHEWTRGPQFTTEEITQCYSNILCSKMRWYIFSRGSQSCPVLIPSDDVLCTRPSYLSLN